MPSWPQLKAHQPRLLFMSPGGSLRVTSGDREAVLRVWPLIDSGKPRELAYKGPHGLPLPGLPEPDQIDDIEGGLGW